MKFSVIVPAFNEEKYLHDTLASIRLAVGFLQMQVSAETELIVVDNESTDKTSEVALASGARVISEPRHNIATVRNAGARSADGEVLVFIDADTIIPKAALWRVHQVINNDCCLGGAIDTYYRPNKFAIRVYLQAWRCFGILTGMAQGAMQFCDQDTFADLGGYDETLYMGEDVDFYWRLKSYAKKRRDSCIALINDVRVTPSTRRFDMWSLWRTLVWTNPLYVLLFRRRKESWGGWYKSVPR